MAIVLRTLRPPFHLSFLSEPGLGNVYLTIQVAPYCIQFCCSKYRGKKMKTYHSTQRKCFRQNSANRKLRMYYTFSGILYLQQLLKICRLLISQIKETIPWVMCMKPHSGTACSFSTLDTHFKWLVTTNTKFMFTLSTSEVHAPPS